MFSVRAALAPTCLAATLALATGCGGGDSGTTAPSAPKATVTVTATPSPSPSPSVTKVSPTTATQYAAAINKAVKSASKVTTLTERNDSNDLLGRPNGYVSAAVLTDRGGDTSDPDPGVAYGATVEVFGSLAAAKRRSDYIQGILRDAPMLGTEYNYLHDKVLLRVSGELPPSVARKYQAAFDAASS